MRLSPVLISIILPLVAAVKKSEPDRFSTYHTKALSSPSLKLDDALYSKLTTAPRDYAVAVLLTAMEPRFGCKLCHEFQPEWDLLARSWMKGDSAGESRTIFGTLDFVDGKNTFQTLMLQTAPVILLFRPTSGPNAKPDIQPVRFDFTTGQQSAESMHAWLSRHLPDGPKPPIARPINYLRVISITTAVLGLVSFLTVAAPYLLPIVQNRNLWAALCIIAVLLFTSGHMFNHIRKVPYVAGNGKGGISYFAGGFQNQFGLETQIVAAIYAVLSFSAISLALKVPRIADPKTQQLAVFIWGGVILGMYSFLLSIFRLKNGGYPFWLPPF